MSSLIPFALPLQRRLTKMYTDTKSSLSFVSNLARDEDAELSALHRKLRIQKDRLMTWGLRWSEASKATDAKPSGLPPDYDDIDESLSQAGLADVVGSVMGTIKDILAEAEPLWAASIARQSTSLSRAGEKAIEAKVPVIVWDKSRFEDLVRDLTSSIDTLYDISRMRQGGTGHGNKQSKKIEIRIEEERAFEKARMETPQVIDPSQLKDSNGRSIVVADEALGSKTVAVKGGKQILYLTKQTSSTNPWKTDGAPKNFPVMVEFTAYDPIYSMTGIGPSMKRFEKLFAGLQRGKEEAGKPEFGVLNLMGYFEDAENSRFGLVYELSSRFDGVSLPNPVYSQPYYARLADMLSHRSLEPALEVKYRLAYNLATSVFDLHSKGVVHGSLAACNIAFFEQFALGGGNADWLAHVDVRRPYLTAYDLFPEPASRHSPESGEAAEVKWYRHELDPRLTPHTVLTTESRSLDLYSLAMLLLEIGLWSSSKEMRYGISSIGIALDVKSDVATVCKQLAARCGTSYLRAVQACWHAVDDEMGTVTRPDVALQKVYGRVLSSLEKCCAIEDDEEEDRDELQTYAVPSLNISAETSKPDERKRVDVVLSKDVLKTRDDYYRKNSAASSASTPLRQVSPVALQEKKDVQVNQTIQALQIRAGPMVEQLNIIPVDEPSKPKAKPRRFPANKIMQEHLNYWHTTLMPQINHSLRGFYRKYPESVEISLESIGETPQKAKPTILVICTSVGKIKSILKRHFVYDSATYGLMVCKGKIVRSRKRQPKRSMAHGNGDEDYIVPQNPHHQKRPLNGASIGAFAEGQALLPVSFGGLIMVDDEPYGLTVHHMLDVPSDDEYDDDYSSVPTIRSSEPSDPSGPVGLAPLTTEVLEALGYELSECGSETSSIASSIESDIPMSPIEPGDIEGISPDCAAGYIVTQPAFDDIDPHFFPTTENLMDDYLDTFTVGELHASSGLRRRDCRLKLTHEIDWALFRFLPDRQPAGNRIVGASAYCAAKSTYPTCAIPIDELGGLEVHAMGRTTGLTSGHILPAITTVKLQGRQTPSQSYVIAGGLGVPGDSGAWVMENKEGKACGHVLAWSERKHVAYFCPMEVMLEDIADTLSAHKVEFPAFGEVRVRGGGKIEEGEEADLEEKVQNLKLESPKRDVGEENVKEQIMGVSPPRSKVFSLLKNQAREEVEELDLVSGMEGMCVSTGLVLQSSGL